MSRTLVAPPDADADSDADVRLSGRHDRSLADADVLGPRMHRRRAFTLVLLTLLVPGSAQLVAGNRRLGRLALRAWLAAVAVVVGLGLLLLVSRSTAIGLLSHSWVLTAGQALLTAYALGWAVLFVDAWRLGRPSSMVIRARRWLTLVT